MSRITQQFNQDMHQINIVSIDVLMQLVQVMDCVRENQQIMQIMLIELAHGKIGAARASLDELRDAMDNADRIALELPDKLGPLVARLNETIAEHR